MQNIINTINSYKIFFMIINKKNKNESVLIVSFLPNFKYICM